MPRRWLFGAASWLWHWLRRPWLAIIAGIIGLILTMAVWQLPQLPGQLVDEHAAATTWLLNTSTAYGIWGNLFLALGLFDVLRSPLLYLLLALLVPTLAAQLADQLGALRQQRSVQRYELATPVEEPGAAIPISAVRPLFRWRGMVNAPPATVTSALENKIKTKFAIFKRAEANIETPPPIVADSDDEMVPTVETRFVATHFPRLHFLRPLFMVGLIIAVAGAWIALAFGWQVTAPPLAPGATFRSANRNLVMVYSVQPTNTLATALNVTLQGEQVELATTETAQQRVGSATIQLRPSYPGIWIATADGGARLALPGESKLRPYIGLTFANPGSEESILIPDQGVGLRIVQRADSDGFVLELYRSDAIQPVYRAELTSGGKLTIPFAPGDTDLIISTLPGLQVDVRHLPGLWVVPLGILLAFIGAVAFLRQSSFIVVQVAPWTPDHAVVVLQSDHHSIVADLRAKLVALNPLSSATGETVGDETLLPPPLPQTTP